MPIERKAQILPDHLSQIVESVFETMFGLEVRGCVSPWFPGSDRLTAAVHLTGNWHGAVLLECSQGQACQFAAHFLSMDPGEIVDHVVRDVLGELANMISGNLKSGLAAGIHRSIPAVVDGSDYRMRVCGAEVCARLTFQCADAPFWVTVLATGA